MPCCNKRRALLASRPPGPAPRGVTAAPGRRPSAPLAPGWIGLACRSASSGRDGSGWKARSAGRIYRASPADRLLTANPEDLRGLLRSGLFAMADPA